MKSRLLKGILATVGLAGVMTVGIEVVRQKVVPNVNVTLNTSPAMASMVVAKGGSVADIIEQALPSVVNIASVRKVQAQESPFMGDPLFRFFFDQRGPSERMERGLGSGVIISSDGIVITNNHVVAKADQIRVVLSDKREYNAKVIGTDPKSDVALLRLAGAKDLRPIRWGDSTRLRLGDGVLAIGNPFGVGQTVTMGIVSATGRANVGIVDYEDFIQTDAAINPGNSGGALINLNGELIGINTAILSRTGGYQGIGFAIPSNMVQPIMNSLVKHGRVMRGWLGVVIQDVDQELAKTMKLPTTSGVLVSDVDPRGPAAKAGMQRGDLIVKLNGQPVDSSGRLRNIVAAAGVKSQATVEYYRQSKYMSVKLTLGELSEQGAVAMSRSGDTEAAGINVVPLSPAARKRFNIDSRIGAGVVIQRIAPDSPAAQVGLQPGDVILEINRATIDSVGRFQQLYNASQGRVLLLVYRGGTTSYVVIPK